MQPPQVKVLILKTEDELKEWRAMTVKLAMKIVHRQDRYPMLKAEYIWIQCLQKHSIHFDTAKKSGISVPIPNDFIKICKTAYDLALLLRSSRMDYEWQQVINPACLSSQALEILGTYGTLQEEPYNIKHTVFGGVIRGNRDTGRLRDGATTLLPPSVVIG